MRKLFFVLTALLFVPIVSNAQIELEVKDGAYRAKDSSWTSSGITADPEAMKYVKKFPQAIEEPDTPILVKEGEVVGFSLKSFLKKERKLKNHFIVYKKNNISFFKEVEMIDMSLYIIIMIIFSGLSLIISNLTYNKRFSGVLISLSLAFFLLVLVKLLTNSSLIVILLCILIGALAPKLIYSNKKVYKITSISLYILLAVYII